MFTVQNHRQRNAYVFTIFGCEDVPFMCIFEVIHDHCGSIEFLLMETVSMGVGSSGMVFCMTSRGGMVIGMILGEQGNSAEEKEG
ncbi:MAG: hypothetical protein RQ746_02345 [Bacteroidales bacterium]|nr:hypothetical protein [Bacteroidales bacterium]